MAKTDVLSLAILGTLAEQPLHGYQIRKLLGAELGPFRALSYGSLYPCLKRMVTDGLITLAEDDGDGVRLAPLPHRLRAHRRRQGTRSTRRTRVGSAPTRGTTTRSTCASRCSARRTPRRDFAFSRDAARASPSGSTRSRSGCAASAIATTRTPQNFSDTDSSRLSARSHGSTNSLKTNDPRPRQEPTARAPRAPTKEITTWRSCALPSSASATVPRRSFRASSTTRTLSLATPFPVSCTSSSATTTSPTSSSWPRSTWTRSRWARSSSRRLSRSENNTIKICDVPKTDIQVQRGHTLDGLGKYYRETITESDDDAR